MQQQIDEMQKSKSIQVLVNEKVVNLAHKETTGKKIKEAALAQGVPIELDFKLFVLKGQHEIPIKNDETIEVHHDEHFRAVNSKPVEVLVNEKPVRLPAKKTTGLEIKQAAIEQHVAIEIGFNLFRIKGHAQTPVGDNETLEVHHDEKFRAVHGDDNS